jgi:hypothetical protein
MAMLNYQRVYIYILYIYIYIYMYFDLRNGTARVARRWNDSGARPTVPLGWPSCWKSSITSSTSRTLSLGWAQRPQ